jgi:hypothetical protein
MSMYKQVVAHGWQATTGHHLLLRGSPFIVAPCPLLPTSYFQIFVHVVNSSSLGTAHARLA